jgi:ssRNA-specific RNase YbeY (16S rRNA maturation enzyme)
VVHGVLHLLDYDHAEPEETAAMRRREQELLERFRMNEGKA